MTNKDGILKTTGSYTSPKVTLLDSVEKLTAGNQTYQYDNGATNPTYINAFGNDDEPRKSKDEPAKPTK